mmetsp:Transcript_71785/g.164616  ORF Transcript_71785/g.164616 Transcript_71785/m.164616 type:complete len:92 (-) Transcript_71785:99-374(-)
MYCLKQEVVLLESVLRCTATMHGERWRMLRPLCMVVKSWRVLSAEILCRDPAHFATEDSAHILAHTNMPSRAKEERSAKPFASQGCSVNLE